MSKKSNHEKAKSLVLPGIDVEGALTRLKVKAETYKTSLLAFVKSYSNFIMEIRGAINREDLDETRRLLHLLKGAAGNIGAKGVELAAKMLGTAVKEEKDDLDQLVANLEFHLNSVLESIQDMEKEKIYKAKIKSKKSIPVIERMVSKLAALLKEYNFDALDIFWDIAPHIAYRDVRNDVKQMQEQMSEFDFNGALDTLKRIAGTTGITILDQELKDKDKKIVLIVDDEPTTILTLPEILRREYIVFIATNGKDALEIAGKEKNLPDIILLDVMMPGMSGYEVCKQLKNNPKTKNIPVIFVTVLDEPKLEEHGLVMGAVDYISKPFNLDIVMARVKTHLELKDHRDHLEQLVKKRTKEIEDTQKEIIFTLSEVMENRSEETAKHVQRVSNCMYLLALKKGLGLDTAELLKDASPMHDIGKIGIPDEILNKRRRLTEAEFKTMKTHTTQGHNILRRSKRNILRTAAIIAYQHHERLDGKGYPQGLKGEDIHIYGRIAAIADAFDAMTNKRCYQKAKTIAQVIEEFKKEKGKQFDPELTDLVLKNIDEFYKIL